MMKFLDLRRRFIAFLSVGVGIVTFFWPLVTIDPAVMGITKWSGWTIAVRIYEGRLPHPATRGVGYIPIDFTLTYCLILIALGCLCLFPSARLLAGISLFGALQSGHALVWDGDRWRFEHMFYGKTWGSPDRAGHVDSRQLAISLILVMVALFLISLDAVSETDSVKPLPEKASKEPTI